MADEAKRPLKVFLCHASGDKTPVRDLYRRLVAEGVDAWLDQEKIMPGQDWQLEIPRAVKESDVVVICLSNNSITKEGYVQKEIRFALDSAEEKPAGTIFLIPARLEDCSVPERLNRWQWVDLFDENGFIKLLRSLKLRADKVGAVIEPLGYEDADSGLEHRLDQLYTEGLAAFWVEDWDKACQRFQAILREQPNHKTAAEKLAQAEQQRNLARLYTQATAAFQSENWPDAIKTLEELSLKSAAYKDVAQLLGNARKQKQLRDLYAEAKTLHTAQKWQAVLKVFEQISVIEPQYPDLDGLLTSAQKEVAELRRLADLNALYSQGVHKMDAGEWYEARSLLEQVREGQTDFLETERLLRKVENEILRIEEGRKRDAQVQMLYEQARKMTRAGQWGKALTQMEEIQKLDNGFVDGDGILEKAKAELEREEQEARRRRELAALYAEAVSLLDAKKYQEALEKWNAIQAIDPKYKDVSRVKSIARRKLEELSRPEVAGQPWSKIVTDWFKFEANIPADRQIVAERMLLLSFALAALVHVLIYVSQNWLQTYRWESVPIGIFAAWAPLAGLYGTVIAFALNRTIENWRRKHSLILVAAWALGFGFSWVINNNLPSLSAYFAGDPFIIFRLLAGLSIIAAIKWAQPETQPISLLIILLAWYMALKAGEILGGYLTSISIIPNVNFYQAGYVLSILFGLLFTLGMQVKGSWDVLKTAFWSALGFAVGNFILNIVGPMFLPPTDFGLGYLLWGFIGGAIFEAPSRDTRRILFSALKCGVGLLLGYLATIIIVPLLAGQSYALQFPQGYAVLRNISLGIGLGLAFSLSSRRASVTVVLTILGAAIYMFTKPDVLFSMDFFTASGIPDAVRGALIGLVLGFGYGYMRRGKSLQPMPYLVITKPMWVGIVGFVVVASVFLFSKDSESVIASPPFPEPELDGYRLDWCYTSGENCGQAVAVEWCKRKGYAGVVSYYIDNSGVETKIIGSGEICGSPCTSFSSITCRQSQNRLSILATSAAPPPPSSYLWDFNSDTQGWGDEFSYVDISIPEAIDGSLTFNSTGGDPQIGSPGLQMDASITSIITLRMRVIQGQGSEGVIFFITDQDGTFDGNKAMIFALGKVGEFRTYNIPMSASPTWQGVITQLRLDPVDDPGPDSVYIEIDYISVHGP